MSEYLQTKPVEPIELASTGERYIADFRGADVQVAYEHIHRYLLAQEIGRGKDVLDIACGEGYGANLIAMNATSVVGIDIAPEVIEHASKKYVRDNLEFRRGNCIEIPLRDASVDVVISFETIEHVVAHAKFLSEIKRVLRPGGVALISSPDKHEYSDRGGVSNPFHVAELYKQDFFRLIGRFFKQCLPMSQRLVAGSYILPEVEIHPHKVAFGTHRGNLQGATFNRGIHEGLYALALCTDGELPEVCVGLFENKNESAQIWDCFEKVRRGLLKPTSSATGEAVKLVTPAEPSDASAELLAEAGAKIADLEKRLAESEKEVVARGQWAKGLDEKVVQLRAIIESQRNALESVHGIQSQASEAFKVESKRLNALVEELRQALSVENAQRLAAEKFSSAIEAKLDSEAKVSGLRIADLEAQLQEARSAVEKISHQYAEATSQIDALEGERARLENNERERAPMITSLQQAISVLEKEKLALEARCAALHAQHSVEIETKNTLHAELLAQMARQREENLASEAKVAFQEEIIRELGEKMSATRKDLDEANSAREQLAGVVNDLGARLNSDAKKVRDYEAQRDENGVRPQSAIEEKAAIENRIDQTGADKISQAGVEIQAMEAEIRSLTAVCEQYNRKDRLNKEVARESEEQMMHAQNEIRAILQDAEAKLAWASSLHADLEATRNLAADEVQRLHHQHKTLVESLRKELNARDMELVAARDKIGRMQASFSWTSTAPLRYLRRHLLD